MSVVPASPAGTGKSSIVPKISLKNSVDSAPAAVPTKSGGSRIGGSNSQINMEQMASVSNRMSEARRQSYAQMMRDQQHPPPCWKVLCARVAESTHFSNLTTLLTIYALMGDDIRLIHTDKPHDVIFDILTYICLGLFSIEVICASIGKDDYFLGFFFTLDVISTASLVLDISHVNEYLFGSGSGSDDAEASQSSEVARAGRASRAGTKAGRIVRLVRLIRLIRIVKLYKRAIEVQEDKKYDIHPGQDWGHDDEDDIGSGKESAVSKKLSEMTTRRVILLVLTMLFVLPWFQTNAYADNIAKSAQYGADTIFIKWRNSLEGLPDYDFLRANDTVPANYFGSHKRKLYEESFIYYVYYHNWFSDSETCTARIGCPTHKFASLFWIGAFGNNAKIDLIPPKQIKEDTWNDKYQGKDHFFSFEAVPAPARRKIVSGWSNNCNEQGKSISLLDYPGSKDERIKCPGDLRWNERSRVSPLVLNEAELKDFRLIFMFDIRKQVIFESELNVCQTIFICILLAAGAMTFSKDANKLVLQPIERMIMKLEKIRNNPLAAISIGDEEHRKEQEQVRARQSTFTAKARLQLTSRSAQFKRVITRLLPAQPPPDRKKQKKKMSEPMETVVLEKTIIKIGSLLALGFGEAGAEIIGSNMKGSDSSALNAMIPGKKVDAIFGFCDIRNFTDATEVLQDQVLLFVNRIAGVVHRVVDDYFGAPNKNVGDAFLLVWRLSGLPQKKQQRLADMALIAFIKIIAQINKSSVLAEYRNHPKLVKRMPNYRVRMGFGLHSGWAIEGAIGSEFKIDASYLSPNVNMASRLEAATKQFGVLMLITESHIQRMTEALAEKCRLIDHIAVKGSKKPLYLYTCDIDDLALEVDRSEKKGPNTPSAKQGERMKFKLRQERLDKKNEIWRDSYNLVELFETDVDIVTMRRKFTSEFFCRFNMAFLNYEAGEWGCAKELLTSTRFLLATEDGPSNALLKFMKQYDFTEPSGWSGYRELKEK